MQELRTIEEYQTVSERSIEKCDERINRLIEEGWEPYGNPYSITYEKSTSLPPHCSYNVSNFVQAMVRYKQEEQGPYLA